MEQKFCSPFCSGTSHTSFAGFPFRDVIMLAHYTANSRGYASARMHVETSNPYTKWRTRACGRTQLLCLATILERNLKPPVESFGNGRTLCARACGYLCHGSRILLSYKMSRSNPDPLFKHRACPLLPPPSSPPPPPPP